jgi:hypothetical protein
MAYPDWPLLDARTLFRAFAIAAEGVLIIARQSETVIEVPPPALLSYITQDRRSLKSVVLANPHFRQVVHLPAPQFFRLAVGCVCPDVLGICDHAPDYVPRHGLPPSPGVPAYRAFRRSPSAHTFVLRKGENLLDNLDLFPSSGYQDYSITGDAFLLSAMKNRLWLAP